MEVFKVLIRDGLLIEPILDMAKLEIAVRKHGENAGKSLVYRVDENGNEEYMVLLRQVRLLSETDDEIALYAHDSYDYAHFNGDAKNIRDFLHKVGFTFPQTHKDAKGKEVKFNSIKEQFEVLGAQGFTCESKSAAWDIVRVRTTIIPEGKEPACTQDGEVLYIHEPVNVKAVIMGGKTYYTCECGISSEEGDSGKEYYESKKLIKNAQARVVYTKDVADLAAHRNPEKTFSIADDIPVEGNGGLV